MPDLSRWNVHAATLSRLLKGLEGPHVTPAALLQGMAWLGGMRHHTRHGHPRGDPSGRDAQLSAPFYQ